MTIADSQLATAVGAVMKKIHRRHWQEQDLRPWSAREPTIYYEETNFQGQAFIIPLVILRSRPCRWFIQGGCVMCNFMLDAAPAGGRVSVDDFVAQVEVACSTLGDLATYPYILVTTAGSFLSDFEIPMDSRVAVLRRLHSAGLRRLSFESEAKYCVDTERLRFISKAFGGEIAIGIGVESHDSFVRNVCLNKGLTGTVLDDARTATLQAGVYHYQYLLLGKPFLSAEEDVEDAIKSVREAVEGGAFMVVLRLINLQPHTLVHFLWSSGRYQLPSLWRALRVLRALPEGYRTRVSIKGFEKDQATPLAFPSGCALCTARLVRAFVQWNLQRDLRTLEAACGSCECELEGVAMPATSLRERVALQVARLCAETGVGTSEWVMPTGGEGASHDGGMPKQR